MYIGCFHIMSSSHQCAYRDKVHPPSPRFKVYYLRVDVYDSIMMNALNQTYSWRGTTPEVPHIASGIPAQCGQRDSAVLPRDYAAVPQAMVMSPAITTISAMGTMCE